MTPDERAAYRPMLEHFQSSREHQQARTTINDLRAEYRARRAALRRKRLILALQILAGALAAAIVLAVTFGFLLEHAK